MLFIFPYIHSPNPVSIPIIFVSFILYKVCQCLDHFESRSISHILMFCSVHKEVIFRIISRTIIGAHEIIVQLICVRVPVVWTEPIFNIAELRDFVELPNAFGWRTVRKTNRSEDEPFEDVRIFSRTFEVTLVLAERTNSSLHVSAEYFCHFCRIS